MFPQCTQQETHSLLTAFTLLNKTQDFSLHSTAGEDLRHGKLTTIIMDQLPSSPSKNKALFNLSAQKCKPKSLSETAKQSVLSSVSTTLDD